MPVTPSQSKKRLPAVVARKARSKKNMSVSKKATASKKANIRQKNTPDKREISKKERNEIKKAVRAIPSLLATNKEHASTIDATLNHSSLRRNITEDEEGSYSNKEKHLRFANDRSIQTSRWWMLFAGVGFFTLIIVVVWMINLSALFHDTKADPGYELDLLKQTKSEFQQAFSVGELPTTNTVAETTTTEQVRIEEKAKESLATILSTLSASTSSVVSTTSLPVDTTTTIIINTNTLSNSL